MNKIKKHWKQFLCRLFGHKQVRIIEQRPRVISKCQIRWVLVYYTQCSRCKKKLSKARRIYGYVDNFHIPPRIRPIFKYKGKEFDLTKDKLSDKHPIFTELYLKHC